MPRKLLQHVLIDRCFLDVKTFLIVAAGNSLSHVGKALALRAALIGKGHRVVIAAGQGFAWIFAWLGISFEVISDIQETDQSSFPTVSWFINAAVVRDCVLKEIALIEKHKPDAVVGIFRFTLKAAAQMAGVPFYAMSCGCLLPVMEEALGFSSDEPGALRQRENVDYFFRYAGTRLERVFRSLGSAENVADGRWLLTGKKTFLWDFPEFMPIGANADMFYSGPVEWTDWPYEDFDYTELTVSSKPLAVVSFGTCNSSRYILQRVTENLLALGFRVVISTGGQYGLPWQITNHQDVQVVNMVSLPKLFSHASLLVTHGGQLTIFSAIRAKIPVLVMPFQPEQAHNAVCLERIGCGARLIEGEPFCGKTEIYRQRLEKMSDAQIRQRIRTLLQRDGLEGNLHLYSNILQGYSGAESAAAMLDKELCS